MNAREHSDGTIVFTDDSGPETLAGYRRIGRRIFRLAVRPGPCGDRAVTSCRKCHKRRQWWCRKGGFPAMPVNPGVCARCQGLVQKVEEKEM
jgi:hypothetical protein